MLTSLPCLRFDLQMAVELPEGKTQRFRYEIKILQGIAQSVKYGLIK